MQCSPFGGSLQVKADFMSFYLAFASLCYIPLHTFQINSALDLLPWICKYANKENKWPWYLSERGSVLKIILFIKI